jgi:integrase
MLQVSPTWMKAVIYFARGLGMRRSEILNLTPANFDPKTCGLNFKRKMGGTSALPVPEPLQNLIVFANQIDPHERILITLGMPRTKRSPLTLNDGKEKQHEWDAINSMLTDTWAKVIKKADANPRLHLHDLRHTAATEAFEHTKDLRTAQQLLGHTALGSTMRYIAPIGPEKLREQLKTINHEWLYKAKPLTELKQ